MLRYGYTSRHALKIYACKRMRIFSGICQIGDTLQWLHGCRLVAEVCVFHRKNISWEGFGNNENRWSLPHRRTVVHPSAMGYYPTDNRLLSSYTVFHKTHYGRVLFCEVLGWPAGMANAECSIFVQSFAVCSIHLSHILSFRGAVQNLVSSFLLRYSHSHDTDMSKTKDMKTKRWFLAWKYPHHDLFVSDNPQEIFPERMQIPCE